jgi:hypothetical protein
MELALPSAAGLERMDTRDIVLAAQRQLALARRGNEAAATERSIIRRRTSRLARAKRQAWTFALIAALVGGALQVFRAVGGDAAANLMAVGGGTIVGVARGRNWSASEVPGRQHRPGGGGFHHHSRTPR